MLCLYSSCGNIGNMEWKQDVEVMDSLAILLKNQKDDLVSFLNQVMQYNDGTPMFAFLQIFGVLVVKFDEHSKKHTEIDALDLTLGEVANHPTVQNMVASMMQKKLNGGLGLE